MAKDKIMLDLFEMNLQNLYNSEALILKSLSKMLEHVTDEELREIIKFYDEETLIQKQRLEEISTYLKIKVDIQDGKIIRALIEDIEWLYEEFQKGLLMDVGIVSKLQHIQHFQISAYETALLYAQHLEITHVAKILNKTLDEAYEGDETCSYHAKRLLRKRKVNGKDIEP